MELYEFVVKALTIGIASALGIAAPFFGIGYMIKLMRASGSSSKEAKQKIDKLEAGYKKLREEFNQLRDIATQYTVSHDDNMELMKTRIADVERKLTANQPDVNELKRNLE